MSAKQARQKTVNINGKDYTLQHPGVRWQVQLQDRIIRSETPTETYAAEVLEHVVVEPPGLTIDDFESYGQLDDLIKAIRAFLRS